MGFLVVVYQFASGCSSWDSKSLISWRDSGGLWGFLAGFGVVVVGFGVVVVFLVVRAAVGFAEIERNELYDDW